MKNLNLKKNQIIIFVIALMLISAGYLNYTAMNKDSMQTSAEAEELQYAGIRRCKISKWKYSR